MKRFNVLLVLFILVGMPMSAWYYLNKGTKMRKEALASLNVIGELNHFELTLHTDSLFSNSDLAGKRWLIGIVPNTIRQVKDINRLQALYRQAKSDFNPNFLILVGVPDGFNQEDWFQRTNAQAFMEWRFSFIHHNHLSEFSKKVFSIPAHLEHRPVVVLVDENNKIRKWVDISDDEQFRTFTTHYPVFLSFKNKHDSLHQK